MTIRRATLVLFGLILTSCLAIEVLSQAELYDDVETSAGVRDLLSSSDGSSTHRKLKSHSSCHFLPSGYYRCPYGSYPYEKYPACCTTESSCTAYNPSGDCSVTCSGQAKLACCDGYDQTYNCPSNNYNKPSGGGYRRLFSFDEEVAATYVVKDSAERASIGQQKANAMNTGRPF